MSGDSLNDFYLRYYVGHKGKFGHEFLEFEFRPDGKMRYANNSQYKNDTLIRKEAYVGKIVIEELKRIIDDSEIMQVRFFFILSDYPYKTEHSRHIPFIRSYSFKPLLSAYHQV